MISKAMQDAINEQIKNEFYSAYMYLSMAAYFQEKNLPGFAAWLRCPVPGGTGPRPQALRPHARPRRTYRSEGPFAAAG